MRLLFVTSTRIGDAVLSTGLLDHLLRECAGPEVTVACGPVAAPLFEALPGRVATIPLRKRRFAGHWLSFWRQVCGTRWDLIVDLRGSLATALVLRRRRHAYHTDRAPVHRVERLSALLGLAAPAAPTLWTAPAHEAEARRRVPEGPPVLALAPIANWRGKEWPIERFIALVDRLTGPRGPLPGGRVMVTGAPHERPMAAPLLEAIPPDRRIDLVDETHLLSVYACFQRAALFIGNDSGLMHMAAAAGCPTLGLFGPTEDRHYAPWGGRSAVVRTPEPVAALMTPDVDVRTTGTLMGSLGVEAVEQAAHELLKRCRKEG